MSLEDEGRTEPAKGITILEIVEKVALLRDYVGDY